MMRLICFVNIDKGAGVAEMCRLINETNNEIKMITIGELRNKYIPDRVVSNISIENITKARSLVCTEGDIRQIARENHIGNKVVVNGNKLMVIGKIKGLYKIVGYDGQVKIVDENAIIALISRGALFSNVQMIIKNGKSNIMANRGRLKELRISKDEEIQVYEMRYQAGDIKAGYMLGVMYFNSKKYAKAENIFKSIRYPTPEQRSRFGEECRRYASRCSTYLYKLEVKKLEPDYQTAWFYLKTSELALSNKKDDRKKMEKYMRRLEMMCISDAEERKSTVAALKDMYRDERFPLYNTRKYGEMYERELAISVEVNGGNETIDELCNEDMELSDDNKELLDIMQELGVMKSFYYRACMYIYAYENSEIDDLSDAQICIDILKKGENEEEREWGKILENKLVSIAKNRGQDNFTQNSTF